MAFNGIIRKVKDSDVDGIRNIYSLYYKNKEDLDYFVNRVKEFLNQSDFTKEQCLKYLIAEKDKKVVGIIGFSKPHQKLIQFTKTQKPVELYSLFVDDKSIDTGVGKALVGEMIKIAKNNDYSEIVVHSASRFLNSWLFYDHLGFKRVGQLEEREGPGEIWSMEL